MELRIVERRPTERDTMISINRRLFLFFSLVILSCSPNIQDDSDPFINTNVSVTIDYKRWNEINSCPAGIDAMTGVNVRGITCQADVLSEWKKIHIKAPGYVNQIRWVRFPNVIHDKILLVPKNEEIIKQNAWKNPKGPRLIFLQLDGMTDQLIELSIATGNLPAMRILKETGASGLIESCCDLSSPSIWTTVLTGLDPSIHGIRDFLYTDGNSGRRLINNSTAVKAPRLWEIAKEFGKKHLVCNAYFTEPEDNKCANVIIQARDAELLRNLTDTENPDLLIVYETEVDHNCHLWWSTAEPDEFIKKGWKVSGKYIKFHSDHIGQSYRELDAWVAFALSIAGPETIILAHSDHGLGPIDSLPEWLPNIGALMKVLNFPGMYECGQSDLESIRLCYNDQIDPQPFVDVCKSAVLSSGQKVFLSVTHSERKDGHPGFVQIKYDLAALFGGIGKDVKLKFNSRSVSVQKLFMTSNSGVHTNFGVVFIA